MSVLLLWEAKVSLSETYVRLFISTPGKAEKKISFNHWTGSSTVPQSGYQEHDSAEDRTRKTHGFAILTPYECGKEQDISYN